MTEKLSGPTRCLIFCSKGKLDKRPQDPYGDFLVKRVVNYASGDPERASLLGTIIGKHAFIVFDYDNPDHRSDCKVLGFRVNRYIKPISVSPRDIDSTVDKWKKDCQNFPRLELVCPKL